MSALVDVCSEPLANGLSGSPTHYASPDSPSSGSLNHPNPYEHQSFIQRGSHALTERRYTSLLILPWLALMIFRLGKGAKPRPNTEGQEG